MNAFTDLFIRRPVLSSVVSLLILLVGLMAGFKLQIRQFPETPNTTITITTTYPGAAADVIKGFITTPIEQAVASAEGIDTLVSTSQQNVSTITLNLRLDANPDRAMADTLSKVNQVRGLLPREANDPVVVKQTGQGFALMYMSFNSKVMTASQITDYLTRVVQPRLQTVDGVANAQILGGQVFAMRIWLDPIRMAALGVTPNDVRAALAANNFTSAAGEVKSDFTQISVNALTSLDSPKTFGQLVIAARGDALVRLGDVSQKIELGPQTSDTSSVFDGLKAVFIGIYGTPEANPLTVIDGVRALMPSIQAQLPPGLNATIAYDSTQFIRASIREVAKTLIEAAAIVIVVIFLFLGNLRSTFIPIVTIPLSLIGVMIALLALGYSINLLTLLALVLGIGLVVDDAIVVVENIHRHIEDGMTPFDASIRGAHEIALPVVAMTITLAAVYAPIGFVTRRHRRAVPRIRLHARGRGHRLGLHRADALADDVLEASAARSGRPLVRPLRRRQLRPPAQGLSAAAAFDAELPGADRADPGRRAGADRGHVSHDATRARAGRGPGHSPDPGQDPAGRQPRLYRAGDEAPARGDQGRRRRWRIISPSTARRASGRPSPACCSSPGTSARAPRSRCSQK